ncbi:MAG: FAD-dependent oxidoreductase [Cyanobacteria bacterium P01_D01_bin.56]
MATVAVVGAGIAGLTCGHRLQTAEHQVIWLEKSRGVGGRMATRRLGNGSWADHGLPYWPASESKLQALTQELKQQGILSTWSAQGFFWQGKLLPTPGMAYCTEIGVNAIAKYLAQSAVIQRQQQVTTLAKIDTGWQLSTSGPEKAISQINADAIVLAIPAPQIFPLVAPLDRQTATRLSDVEYAPCLSLMATHGDLPEVPLLNHQQGWHITAEHPIISWLSLDSSKPKAHSNVSTVVIHSQADFAARYLEQLDALKDNEAERTQLQQTTINQLLNATVDIVPGLNQPQQYRLQRWRYSVVTQPYSQPLFQTPWPTLVGCGDWCDTGETSNLATAYISGIAAAEHIQRTIA